MSQKRLNTAGPLGVQLGLIITPMLDMSFQILAFFIMTYHPAALEGHIPGSLLPRERGAMDPGLPMNDIDVPEMTDAVTVQVKAIGKGQDQKRIAGTPGQIFIRTNLDAAPEFLEGSDVADFKETLQLLEKRLKQFEDKKSLKIDADGGLRYQYVLMVHDAAKRAGFEKVHFLPPQVKSKIKQ